MKLKSLLYEKPSSTFNCKDFMEFLVIKYNQKRVSQFSELITSGRSSSIDLYHKESFNISRSF